MEIILLKDIDKVGSKHEVVTVKDGYGRNYLIPQGLALIANDTNMRRLNDLRRREQAQEAKMLGHYQEIASKLEGVTLKIGAKAGTSGKIFGSITALQIAGALKDQFGVEVDRRKVVLPDEIKNIGNYTGSLNLHPEVQPPLSFEVIAE